jgi:hypothetical protein
MTAVVRRTHGAAARRAGFPLPVWQGYRICTVMAGLVPAIHVFFRVKTWMPGIKPGMTNHMQFPSPPGRGSRPRSWLCLRPTRWAA